MTLDQDINMDKKYQQRVSKELKRLADGLLRVTDRSNEMREWATQVTDSKSLEGLYNVIQEWDYVEASDKISNKISNKGVKDKINLLVALIKSNLKICKGLNNFDTNEYTEDLNYVVGMETVVNTRTITKDEKIHMNIINKKHLTIQRILDSK